MTSKIRAFYSQRQDEAQERPQPTLPHDTERFVAARSQARHPKKDQRLEILVIFCWEVLLLANQALLRHLAGRKTTFACACTYMM